MAETGGYLLPTFSSLHMHTHTHSYKRSANLSQFVIHRGLIISVMQVCAVSDHFLTSVLHSDLSYLLYRLCSLLSSTLQQ